MSFCMGCGKQIESGDYCEVCSANMQQSQNAPVVNTVQAPVEVPAPAVQIAASAQPPKPKKKIFNGKMIAMLSLLGIFGVMTIVVEVLFH